MTEYLGVARSLSDIQRHAEEDQDSEANTLATLPSFLGEYEAKTEIVQVPQSRQITPNRKETAHLQAILSAPVTATLPLADFLKVKPKLWQYVAELMGSRHFALTKEMVAKEQNKDEVSSIRQVPFNKVSAYQERNKDKGNATLPVEYNGVKTMAILDTGAGIGIATKAMWEKWGKKALRKTRMDLQLADGNLERPLGLLENVIIKTCGIDFEHTFAIVDFGQDPNYEVILGRPFMRQLMVLEDWGYDYLYLRHEDVTTRVNLRDHTFRDVTKTPVDEFESASSDLTPHTSTATTSVKDAWICAVPSQDLLEEDKRKTDRLINIKDYIPIPFPEDDIDPYEWNHTLATMDVCALPPQTQFCDEEGYEIVPVRVVTVVQGSEIEFSNPESSTLLKMDRTDVSIVDLSTDESDYPYLDLDTAGYINESDLDSYGDDIVSEEELAKVRLLLQGREAILLDEQPLSLRMKRKKQREKRKEETSAVKG